MNERARIDFESYFSLLTLVFSSNSLRTSDDLNFESSSEYLFWLLSEKGDTAGISKESQEQMSNSMKLEDLSSTIPSR